MFGIDDMALAATTAAALNFIGGERANAANAEQVSNQMAYQERMSGTSHQREVADLRAAGLNPILSARLGGSSSPVGASAHMINSAAMAAQAGSDVYRAGLEGRRNPSMIGLNEASARQAQQAAYLSVEQQEVARRTARKIGVETDNIEAGTAKVLFELRDVLPSIVELNRASVSERAMIAQRISFEIEKILPLDERVKRAEAQKIHSMLEGIFNEEAIDRTEWGLFWRYVGRIGSAILGGLLPKQ